jgi:hypothetical protein
MLAVTSNKVFLRSMLRLLVTSNVVPSSLILVILMMEAIHSIKTTVFTTATCRKIQEDGLSLNYMVRSPS